MAQGETGAEERAIEYSEPQMQQVYITVTAKKGTKFEPVEAHYDGISVRRDGVKEIADLVRWSAVMIALRWALPKSAQMRSDVRSILDAIEKEL